LVLRKTSKFDATRCQILRLKCPTFDFRWVRPQTQRGRLQRSPSLLDVFKGPTSKGRKRVEGGEEKKRGKGNEKGKGRGTEGEGKGGKGGREERRREGICRTNVKLLPTGVFRGRGEVWGGGGGESPVTVICARRAISRPR